MALLEMLLSGVLPTCSLLTVPPRAVGPDGGAGCVCSVNGAYGASARDSFFRLCRNEFVDTGD